VMLASMTRLVADALSPGEHWRDIAEALSGFVREMV